MLLTLDVKNAKSLKSVSIELDRLTTLLGSNGTGKSNIINVLKYFYECMDSNKILSLEDNLNPYIQYSEVVLKYDMRLIKSIVTEAITNKVLGRNTKNYFLKINEICQKYCDKEGV